MKASAAEARRFKGNMKLLDRLHYEQSQGGLPPPRGDTLSGQVREGRHGAEAYVKRVMKKEANLLQLIEKATLHQDEPSTYTVVPALLSPPTKGQQTLEKWDADGDVDGSWAKDHALEGLLKSVFAADEQQPRATLSPQIQSSPSLSLRGFAGRRANANHSVGTGGWIPWD